MEQSGGERAAAFDPARFVGLTDLRGLRVPLTYDSVRLDKWRGYVASLSLATAKAGLLLLSMRSWDLLVVAEFDEALLARMVLFRLRVLYTRSVHSSCVLST